MSIGIPSLDPSVLAAALVRGPRPPRLAAPVSATGRPRRLLPPCACCDGPARVRVGSAGLAAFLEVAVGDRVCGPCVAAGPLTE